MRANYTARCPWKEETERFSGEMGSVKFFFTERNKALICQKARIYSTCGAISDRQECSEFTIGTIGRFNSAIWWSAAPESMFEGFVWMLSQHFSSKFAPHQENGSVLRECLHRMNVWGSSALVRRLWASSYDLLRGYAS